jgi:hypothetical protein
MAVWYVRVTTFEHFRIEAETPEAAATDAVAQVEALAGRQFTRTSYVQTEVLGWDVTTTDEDGDPIGEAAVAGGEYPPQDITGGISA